MFIRTPRLLKVGRSGLIGRQPPPARGTATLSADVDTSKLGHVARRRIASPPMKHVERAVDAVGSALQRWANAFIARVLREVPLKQDATVDQVYASLGDPKVAKAKLEEAFRAVDKASSDDLRVVGVRTGSIVPNADRLQSEWIERNTDLIKAQRDVVARVRKVIEAEVPQGTSVADIRKKLQEQAGYARSRAELTARDQTLKLYGRIQQERQQAAGFTHYVWTTSLDERVRERHAELDGQVFAWDDPPVVDERTGRREHPGFDYQCRCSAVPFTGDDVGEAEGEELPEIEFEAQLPEPPKLQTPAEIPSSQEAPFSLAGKTFADLDSLPITPDTTSPGALEAILKDPEFQRTGRRAGDANGIALTSVDGKLELNEGRHRLTAARQLGLNTVYGTVKDTSGKVLYRGDIPLKSAGANPQEIAVEAAQARLAQAAPPLPAIEAPAVPLARAEATAAELRAGATEVEVLRGTKKRAAEQIEAAIDSAVRGKSLRELGALDDVNSLRQGSFDFLRQDPIFAATGNLLDNFASGPGGLPQFGIEPSGRVYLNNGRHRLTVARELGLRQIMARVVRYNTKGDVVWEYVGYIRV